MHAFNETDELECTQTTIKKKQNQNMLCVVTHYSQCSTQVAETGDLGYSVRHYF